MWKRLSVFTAVFGLAFSFMYMRIFYLMFGTDLKETATSQSTYTVSLPKSYPTIYDCNMKPLNNCEYKIMAVVKPDPETMKNILPYVSNVEALYEKAKNGTPFTCEVNDENIADENILTFKIPIRNSNYQTAAHIIGYRNQTEGVAGLEKAYNSFFEENKNKISVNFSADGKNRILDGKGSVIDIDGNYKTGIVTTIDKDIQEIAETAASKIKKGAVVVMDVKTGEIRASVSVPSFSPNNIAECLNDTDSPLVNRSFSAYSVGSVFKMVTAAAAIEADISPDLQYECIGYTEIGGKRFNCHKHDGHGMLDMQNAVAESCNTYFIELSKQISDEDFISKASALGFGCKDYFTDNYYSAAGNLQTISDIQNEGEKANMSFGQGKLTATPVQVTAMTCAIANYGQLPQPKLILGKTFDGINMEEMQENVYTNAVKPSTAVILRNFMAETINNQSTYAARPENTTAGGKTSTAQTGRYDDTGNEYVNAWFTGYFPEMNPEYAVTVMVEDGVSGNLSAGPVFKEIAEKVTVLKGENEKGKNTEEKN